MNLIAMREKTTYPLSLLQCSCRIFEDIFKLDPDRISVTDQERNGNGSAFIAQSPAFLFGSYANQPDRGLGKK